MSDDTEAAIEQLTNHQQQLDMHGEFVGVSRQALDELLAGYTTALSQRDEARALALEEGFRAGFHAAERALGFEDCDESNEAVENEWSEFRALANDKGDRR